MALNNAVNATVTGFQSLNTATGVWNGRSLIPGTGISITNQDGTGGNPVISATGGINPGAVVQIIDDFIGVQDASDDFMSQIGWDIINFTMTSTNLGDNGHPGFIGNQTNPTNGFRIIASQFDTNYMPIILGGGAITLNWVIKINTLAVSTNYTLRVGFGDTVAVATDQANGLYFEYSNTINSGNWVYKSANAGTRTTTNSAVAVTTGWHNLLISINAAATSVSFSVDGVSLGAAITTNIPTTNAIAFTLNVLCPGGVLTEGTILADLVYYNQTLTSARF